MAFSPYSTTPGENFPFAAAGKERAAYFWSRDTERSWLKRNRDSKRWVTRRVR